MDKDKVGADEAGPLTQADFASAFDVPRVAVNEQLKPELITLAERGETSASAIVTPPGFNVHGTQKFIEDFERTQEAPYRRRGTYIAADIKSLLDWMLGHSTEDSPVFGQGAENLATNWANPKLSLIGIANYSSGPDKPQWHDLRARYDFPVTAAWKAWTDTNGALLKQGEFAEFVERHLYEFSEPLRNEDIGEACTRMIEALGGTKKVAKPGDMYDVSRGVTLTVSDKVEVSLDPSSGEQTLRHTEEHTGKSGQPVKIPKFFYIRLPIFFGEEPSLIGVLLRYRNAGGGSVLWAYELFAPDLVVKSAFERACAVVTQAKRKLYLGTPDTP